MKRAVIAGVAVAAVLAGTAIASPPQASTASAAGTGPGDICHVRGLSLAPSLASDRTPAGAAVQLSLDRRGKFVPIIMVHGWDDRAGHSGKPKARPGPFDHLVDLTATPGQVAPSSSSLIGRLQGLTGTAVYSFDYEKYAARWVTDDNIGPALGRAIDCLYQATGEKVIVVAHSMGGLATRWALNQPGSGGVDRATKVSTVVTFGTPEQGSLLASLAAAGLNAGAIAGGLNGGAVMPLLRLILAECGQATTTSMTNSSLCQYLPDAVRSFDSAAGQALRYGSAQLAALKPWPKSVTVDALAGEAAFQLPTAGWFGLPAAVNVAAGDLVVTSASATAGATVSKTLNCTYPVNPIGMAGNVVRLVTGTLPVDNLTGACFHTDLTRSIELTGEAIGRVTADLAARQPLIASDLQSAPVPAMCGYPAGRFVNGIVPGYPSDQGQPRLATVDGRPAADMIALGDLNGDGIGDAAAVVNCNGGGVGWPDSIVFYTQGSQGPVPMGSFQMANVVGDARDGTTKLTYHPGGSIKVDTLDARPYDFGCCPSGYAAVTLKWDGQKIVAAGVQHLPGPYDISFTGVGAIKLGMTGQQLVAQGYVASPGDYYGCVYYSASNKPAVTFDPTKNAVVAIKGLDDTYHTGLGGIGIGTPLSAVAATFSGHVIENHMDGSFGQGMNGLLVGDGGAGWIGFISNDGLTVSLITVSDHGHYGALEAGCP